ncbi:hypothetical protein Q5Y75_08000 [Ruegeria sp. 2205SS24-7]|uniref:hypothetical protein n=1 Tax=Ruegeria discodermiae TaxID=3064389 RepID=UPI002741D800|nr:hypothetical protein [Ruegeria sp. 2205SS24-7]MDP5217156.1 hypothetical protein [Ruegeria sp. 2205SS24-7]
MATEQDTAQGIDALIDRLRSEGVQAGSDEAARLTQEAQAKAAQIVETAQAEATKLQSDARDASDRYTKAGEEALNTAMRDAVLTMKSTLMAQFQQDVQRMVSETMSDPEMLKQMVLELVGRARTETGISEDAKVILPVEVVGPDAIRANADDIQSGQLTKFVLGLTQEMLKDGVALFASSDLHAGIRAQASADGIKLDLSDEAIADVLMQHLQPRFRAVLEGVIR